MARPARKHKAHADRSHADISPSGADRWWNCPGSVDLITKLQPPESTNYNSELGTAAHELLEMSLRTGRAPIAYLGHTVNEASKEKINHEFVVDRSMAVCVEEAIDYIQSFRTPGDTLLTEEELDIPATGQPGHVDVCRWDTRYLDVFDYKNGTNPVEVQENKQAMLYALGAKHRMGAKAWASIKKVRVHIIQPRSRIEQPDGPASMWTLTPIELNMFEGEAVAKVAEIRSGKAPLIAGEVQCYYCPVKARCPTLAKHAIEAARLDFIGTITKPTPKDTIVSKANPVKLDNMALGHALTALPLMELWIEAVRALAANEIGSGRKIPFFKLVEGRSQRRWEDDTKVRKAFAKLGFKEDDYAPRKLVGIGAAEDLLAKAQREPFFKKHAIKPKGNPTLAPESDPRPPYDRVAGAKIDFEDDILK